jgi:hypothetical protein
MRFNDVPEHGPRLVGPLDGRDFLRVEREIEEVDGLCEMLLAAAPAAI